MKGSNLLIQRLFISDPIWHWTQGQSNREWVPPRDTCWGDWWEKHCLQHHLCHFIHRYFLHHIQHEGWLQSCLWLWWSSWWLAMLGRWYPGSWEQTFKGIAGHQAEPDRGASQDNQRPVDGGDSRDEKKAHYTGGYIWPGTDCTCNAS